jgi:hypothetical protein
MQYLETSGVLASPSSGSCARRFARLEAHGFAQLLPGIKGTFQDCRREYGDIFIGESLRSLLDCLTAVLGEVIALVFRARVRHLVVLEVFSLTVEMGRSQSLCLRHRVACRSDAFRSHVCVTCEMWMHGTSSVATQSGTTRVLERTKDAVVGAGQESEQIDVVR